MELIEKLLLIHDTQIKKWGKINGLFSLIGGIVFIVISPLLYLLASNSFSIIKIKFIELGNRVEPGLGQELGNSFSHLETALIWTIVLFFLLGVMIVTSAILMLKLHKRLQGE
jgi:ABC-type antimicrobial peptide transport system permease subunit